MERIHYYFGWFEKTIPSQLADMLNSELADKKSLVIISTAPKDDEYNDGMMATTKDVWFEPAGVVFENYHSIDYRVGKEEAQALIKDASAILLHGGFPVGLKNFLAEYEMADFIRQSRANVLMGASAGGMNMGTHFVDRRELDVLYDGMGFDNLAFFAHAHETVEEIQADEATQARLATLPKDLDVYVGCEESTLRVKGDDIMVIGDVFKISGGKITKI